jgi:hypothetical protein
MAKTKISEFSTTAGNNTDINSINIAEGCAPSGINDAIRELMRQLKEFQTGGAGDSVNSGGDFSVATNKFTVASASGNTAVAGTLAVTGTTTLTGALVANGNATLGDASGDTVTIKGTPTLEVNPTLSGGTANGVAYLNGSKVVTTGSALTFDGTNLGVGTASPSGKFHAQATNSGIYFDLTTAYTPKIVTAGALSDLQLESTGNGAAFVNKVGGTSSIFQWLSSSSEWMRLTSTGLGIGTSSPAQRLHVYESTAATGAFMQVQEVGGQNAYFGVNTSGGSIQVSGANPLQFAINGSERARIDSSGNLLVGANPTNIRSSRFVVGGAFSTGTSAEFNNTDSASWIPLAFHTAGSLVGYISSNTTTTAYNTSSDYRLKEDIAPMTGALAKVAALKPVTYKWKADGSDGEGFIAHELQEVVPQCVTGEKDAVDEDGKPKYQGIDTSFLVATLTAAIQEQQAQIESLTQRLAQAGI